MKKGSRCLLIVSNPYRGPTVNVTIWNVYTNIKAEFFSALQVMVEVKFHDNYTGTKQKNLSKVMRNDKREKKKHATANRKIRK